MPTGRSLMQRLPAALCCGLLTGCALFSRPLATASSSQTLSWLTQWVAAPLDSLPGFDVELLKPPAHRPEVAADDLLEVTVWDLYEPGKPHTYPVRVSSNKTIEVPLLGDVSVAKRTVAEIERSLADQFRERDILLNPRVLVRSLDAPVLKVHVTGAVVNPGYVEITREEPTVYAALISAGGLRKNVGAQIGVRQRWDLIADVNDPGRQFASAPETSMTEAVIEDRELPAGHGPVSLANSLEVLSVSATAVTPAEPAETPQPLIKYVVLDPHVRPRGEADIRWYDLSRESDVAALRELVLSRGDELIVKAAAAPIRISGMVQRPGPYPLPSGRKVNVWQALELAGGMRSSETPMNITLYRPAGDGHGSQRWFLHVDSSEQRPVNSPMVEPGDILHVEPTAAGKIKRAVGDLWNKP